MVFLNNRLKNENIICISTSDWQKPYGSKQQIMSILAADNRILYVEAQTSLLHILLHPIEGLRRLVRFSRGVVKKDSLYIYTPLPLLPFGNYVLLFNRVNQAILFFFLKKIVRRFDFNQAILWIYSVNSASLLGKFNEKLSIYYCLDDFPSEIASKRRRMVMQYFETSLLIKSDVVFACTKSLYEDRKGIRPDIYFIRNGVDFESFRNSNIHDSPDEVLRNINSPRIGLIGTFDSRVDTDIVLSIAKERPQWQIVLVGSNTRKGFSKQALRRYPNIHNLGFKENKLLSAYVKSMDVCIIPYHTYGFNRHLFPLKTLEYLAAGKPVISTPLPELDFLKDVICIAKDKEEFIKNIEFLLMNKNNGYQDRVRIAESNSWELKVEELSRRIAQGL